VIIAERWLESRRIGEAVRVDGRGDDGAQRPMEARKGSRLVAVGGRGDGAGGARSVNTDRQRERVHDNRPVPVLWRVAAAGAV
jgi:hypothetical protein